MSPLTGRPPDPRDTAAPRGKAEGGPAVTWLGGQEQGMSRVCPVLHLPGIGPIQTRSTVPWSPARGHRLRAEAARRLPPLRSGYRDPDASHPSDAPDEAYARWLAQLGAPERPETGDAADPAAAADEAEATR